MGLLVPVRDNQFKIRESFRCNSELLKRGFWRLNRRVDSHPKPAAFEFPQRSGGRTARR